MAHYGQSWDVLWRIRQAINSHKGWSVLRAGERELEMLTLLLNHRAASEYLRYNGNIVMDRSEIFEMYREGWRNCDQITTMASYSFREHPKLKDLALSKMAFDFYKTRSLDKLQNIIFNKLGVEYLGNSHHCSALINYLMFAEWHEKSLFEVLEETRSAVCVVTSMPQVMDVIRQETHRKIPVTCVEIPRPNGNQHELVRTIKSQIAANLVSNCKVFLLACGILKVKYAHFIRSTGGVAIDIGSVVDAWADKGFYRLNPIKGCMNVTDDNRFRMVYGYKQYEGRI